MVREFAACLIATVAFGTALAQTSTESTKTESSGTTPVGYLYFSEYVPGHASLTPGQGQTQIEGYSVAADGTLTKIPGSPFASHDFPTQLCANGKYLFASTHIEQGSNQYPSKMMSYSIGQNGTLTLSHALGNANLTNITLDHKGEVLYGLKGGQNDLLSYRVRWSDGGLEYLGQVTAPDMGYGGPWLDLPVTFSADDRFAYETTVYAYERTDEYHNTRRVSSGNPQPSSLIVTADPNNNLAAIMEQLDANGNPHYSIGSYQIAEDGTLTSNLTQAESTGTSLGSIDTLAMSPDGKYFAVSGFDTVQIYHWNGKAAPTHLAIVPVAYYPGMPGQSSGIPGSAVAMRWDNSDHLFAYVEGFTNAPSGANGYIYEWVVTESGATTAPGTPLDFQNPISTVVEGPGLEVQSLTAQTQ